MDGINEIGEIILLKNLNIKIKIKYNDNILNSQVDELYLDWVNKCFDYYDENKNNIIKDVFLILIYNSAKMFNFYFINIKYNKKMWHFLQKRLRMSKESIINNLNNFIIRSPKTNIDVVTYHGTILSVFDKYTKNNIWVPNRFLSTTLDHEHAGNYANYRLLQSKKDNKNGNINDIPIIVKIIVNKNQDGCLYHPYENQIVFSHKTKFEIIKKKSSTFLAKDVLEEKYIKPIKLVGYVITVQLIK